MNKLAIAMALFVTVAGCSARQTAPPPGAAQPDRFLFERGTDGVGAMVTVKGLHVENGLHQFLADDRFGPLDFGGAFRDVLVDDRLEAVDVVEEHLLDVAYRRLDVARQRDVDKKDRAVATRAAQRLKFLARDDRVLRAGRGDAASGASPPSRSSRA